jgi:hypothetical protein
MSAAEIHRELCAVYSLTALSEGTVRQWCSVQRDDEQIFMMKSKVVGQPAVASDDLVLSERRRFTISERSCQFPQISRTVLCEIFTARLGYHKFCARWVPKILTGAHKRQRVV